MPEANIKAVVLDLFDTLVVWEASALPTLEWRGRTVRSTVPWLVPALKSAMNGRFELSAFLEAYHSVLDEIVTSRQSEEPIEITCFERFARTLRRLDINGSELDSIAERLARVHMAGVRRVTHAPEDRAWAVRRLRPFYRMGLLSNFDDSRTGREILLDTGVSHLFDAVIISADVGLRKPHPRIFARMLEMLAIPARDVLFVGDTPDHDVAGPMRAGMRTAWISMGRELPAGLPAPDFVIRDLSELPALLGC
jgi:HAD superfamily hydrolase (TIGR01549 family)